ncbi:MAG: YHS domain-containing protein [Acidobacteriota bacterium]
MRSTLICAAALLVAISSFGLTEEKRQTKCPVMGGDVDPATSIRMDYQGQRIYFCCAGCPSKFKADPEKYFAKLAAEGIALENIQAACPVTGDALKKRDAFTDYKGRRVYFCCKDCVSAFEKNPPKYLQQLNPISDKSKAS